MIIQMNFPMNIVTDERTREYFENPVEESRPTRRGSFAKVENDARALITTAALK